MDNVSRSALELYMNRIFKMLIVFIPIIALCAGCTYTALKVLGYYEDVPIVTLIAFDASCVVYFIVGYIFAKKCEDKNGNLKPKVVFKGKIFICCLIFIQWCFITHLIPSREFWAYIILFVMVVVFFLDSKMVAVVIGEMLVCVAVSYIFKGDALLPVKDEFYVPNIVLRAVLIVLTLFCMWLFTYLVETRLVAELEKISDYDTLTMLYNRRKMTKFLDNAILNAKKTGTGFAVMMCDLDDFKLVNDTYGHDCGDMVLKNIASVIMHSVNQSGGAFRYGGEEVLSVLYADSEQAKSVAEEIRRTVEKSFVEYDGNKVTVTITIGVAVYEENDISPDYIIKRADSNLYFGKTHGKNRVIG